MRRVVVAIYIDPDFYPPTINAILNLAEVTKEVIVISRNNCQADFPYPPNVYLKKVGRFSTVRNMEKQSIWLKVTYFLQFNFYLNRYAKSSKTNLVLLYDPFALFAFYLVKRLRRNKKIWYHNHDMPAKGIIKKYSIGGLAAKYEERAMKYINFFSLPSKERMNYYPGIDKSIPIFIIPNYPSLKVYNNPNGKSKNERFVKIIFQGFIGTGHGLEEIIELLPRNINGCSLLLVLKGSVTDEYKSFLNKKAEQHKVAGKLIWLPIGPYSELPAITSSCDIGIGINMNTDNVSQTQGTASNKIYEYAASRLPVILYDSNQFRKYLDQYEWAFFTNGTLESLKQNIEWITRDLLKLGNAARESFETGLNFETEFRPVLEKITGTLI